MLPDAPNMCVLMHASLVPPPISSTFSHLWNRKLLEKQVQNHFASYEIYIGLFFFYNVNATVSFGNRLYSNFSPDWQTDKQTDKQTDRQTKPIA